MQLGLFFDVLGRPLMPCCGALVLDTRPFQCVHDYEGKVKWMPRTETGDVLSGPNPLTGSGATIPDAIAAALEDSET